MKLFMVHVGFYDDEVGEGIYESHVNFFIAAGNAKSAKKKIMSMDKFRNKKRGGTLIVLISTIYTNKTH